MKTLLFSLPILIALIASCDASSNHEKAYSQVSDNTDLIYDIGQQSQFEGSVLTGEITIMNTSDGTIYVQVISPTASEGITTYFLQTEAGTPLPEEIQNLTGEIISETTHIVVNLPEPERSILLQLTGETTPNSIASLYVSESYSGYGLGYLTRVSIEDIISGDGLVTCGCYPEGTTPEQIREKLGLQQDVEPCTGGGEYSISCGVSDSGGESCNAQCSQGAFSCCTIW